MNQSRYDRQIRLSMIGQAGQDRLENAHVAILGCGALGTVAADILARAGVGHLKLIDRDVVEWTNLQRQSLFTEQDARQGRAKADAACEAIGRANSQIRCEPLVADVTSDNIASLLEGCDLVVDAADNFAVRFLLNDYSLEQKLPWVHGGCIETGGQIAFFSGNGKPCFRCFVPQPPPASSVPTCDSAGVLGAATHMIASLQAAESIKWITGEFSAIREGVFSIDLWSNRSRQINLPSSLSADCPACGKGRRDYLASSGGNHASAVCGRLAVQLSPVAGRSVDLATVVARWQSMGEVTSNRFFARLKVSEAESLTLFRDGRALIEGTSDIARARIVYAQVVGE
jgi:molybdopterin/thiamine biosynthesis adenylyltransferase